MTKETPMTAQCAICQSEERLVRDHDHLTGEIRGWLCARCNVMLGYAADSQDRLQEAARYLATTNRTPRVALGTQTPAKRDRAAYMREYRKRKPKVSFDEAIRTGNWAEAAKHPSYDEGAPFRTRIAELEEEVRHLKAELAKRPTRPIRAADIARGYMGGDYNSRPFTPAPKTRK